MRLEQSIGFMINHAGRRLSHLLTCRLQPFDITTEQWTVLNRLAERDGTSQKELARRAEKDQTNLTRILGQLERKGLIERRANAADRRSFLTFITEKGRSLNETVVPVEQEVIRTLLEDLSAEQIQSLRATLSHITEKANSGIRELGETL